MWAEDSIVIGIEPLLPSLKTLARYGLDEPGFFALAAIQGNVCAVCKKLPASRRLCVEHEHVKGWARMPPEQRRTFVRGLCCFVCNTQYLGRGITVEKARAVVEYLQAYDAKRAR